MSEPVFEASVRIHADTSTVGQEAAQGIKGSLDKVEQQAQARVASFEQRAAQRAQQQAALDARIAAEQQQREQAAAARRQAAAAEQARLQPELDLQAQSQIAAVRSQTAGLAGDEATRNQFELESVVKGTQAAALTMARTSQDLVAEAAAASGYQQELLLAQAQNATVAAERLRAEANRLQREGLPQEAEAAQRGGGLRGLLRHEAGGRSTGLLGLLGGGLRFGAAGLAFTAAFESLRELQGLLRAEGDEAFTAQGKIRNLGAELLGGNLIGGIRALAAERKATFEGDLGDKLKAEIDKQKTANDFLIVSEEKLAAIRQKGPDEVAKYAAALAGLGKISIEQAIALVEVNKDLERQEKLAQTTADAWANYAQQVEKAGGSLERAFGPDSRGGPRGPGGVEAGRPITAGTPVFQAGSGGPEVAAQIRESINSRIQDELLLAQARRREAQINQKTAQESFNQAKENVQHGAAAVNSAADEYLKLVQANTALANATSAVETTAAAAAAHGQALADSIRDAQAAALAPLDPGGAAQATLRSLQIKERNAKRAFEEATKGTKEANEAYAAWRVAQAATAQQQAAITAQAREDAAQAQERRKSATEQKLATDITIASLTKRTSDDKVAFDAAIRYWVSLRNHAKDTQEQEEARAQVVSLYQARAKALAGGDSSERQQLERQRLDNAIAAAEFAGSIPRQRRATDALVAYWREQVKTTEGLEKAQAQASLIAAQGKQKAVAQAATDLQELRLRNRAQAAQLTDDTSDDKRAADAIVKFWERQVKAATGAEKARKQSELIAARLARKALDDTDEAASTTVFDLLSRTAGRFSQFAGNLQNANNPFTQSSFVGEVAQYFRPGLDSPDQLFGGPSGFTANLDNFRNRNSRIPGSGLQGSVDKNTAATDRLTDAILSGPIARNDKRYGMTYGEIQGARGQAMADFWKARQARQAAEAGVGAAGAGF